MYRRLITFCLALTAVTANIQAEELWVAGVQVSLGSNKTGTITITGSNIKSGIVTYNYDTKTLTLNGVTIERSGDNNRGLRSSVSGLTVEFSGTNKITTTSASGLRFEANTTIKGSGTLTVKSNETAVYIDKNTKVTISGNNRNRLSLNVSGQYGVQGETNSNGETLSIQRWVTMTAHGSSNTIKNLKNLTIAGDANVTLKGSGKNATVNDLVSLTMTGMQFEKLENGILMFDSSLKTVVVAGVGYKGDITIKPALLISETSFPDENFRKIVASNIIDANTDGYLSDKELLAVTELNVKNKKNKDLTGVSFFTELKSLSCSENGLSSQDVSKNKKLETLSCSYNGLESLNVSNTVLKTLECDNNKLKSLDITQNTALTTLECSYNGLESLDVSKNTALTTLKCGVNKLVSLNVVQNTALTTLNVACNSLESLNVSKNTALTTLTCYDNKLSSLDVTNNKALTKIECYENKMKDEGMDKLVNSLPSSGGVLYVYVEGGKYPSDNFITVSQVDIAKGRNWKVKKLNGGSYSDYAGEKPSGDADGTGKVNKADIKPNDFHMIYI